MIDPASLVPSREAPVTLGWLRSVVRFQNQQCRAGTPWAESFRRLRDDRLRVLKPYWDELRPFCYLADALALPNETRVKLKEQGCPHDISFVVEHHERMLQVTLAYFDASVLFPSVANITPRKFEAGYQRALAAEVTRREGSASDQALYYKDTDSAARIIEETEIALSAEELCASIVSGVRRAISKKAMKHNGDCELLVWYPECEGYHKPDYCNLVQRAWQTDFNNRFRQVHVLFGDTLVTLSSTGTIK
ncbi:hypothetical protein ACQKH5_12875 [Hyphomonas sp. NPDC076900]|uniref:hypothetical protein n=1 Tax=unclassified Hyphomonas TaxID=2630699 RepID=UPI003D08B3FA